MWSETVARRRFLSTDRRSGRDALAERPVPGRASRPRSSIPRSSLQIRTTSRRRRRRSRCGIRPPCRSPIRSRCGHRFTFGRRGREGLVTHHFQGLVVFGFCLGLTTLALAALGALAPDASQAVEVAVLIAANAAATLLRYWLLRLWVFGPRARRARAARGASCKDWRRVRRLVRGRPEPTAAARATTRRA